MSTETVSSETMALKVIHLYRSMDERRANLVLDFSGGHTASMTFSVGTSAKEIAEMLMQFGALLSKQGPT